MSALLEKWRGLMRQPDDSFTTDGMPGDNIESIARMGDLAVGYESNWTKMLTEEPVVDPEAIKRADVAATKAVAQELCRSLSPTLCQCPGNPLKCHAVRVYMQPSLKIVQALRKSKLLR